MASKKRDRKDPAPSVAPAYDIWDRLASPRTIFLGLAAAVLLFYFKPLFSAQRLDTVGRGGRAIQRAEPPLRNAARRQAAAVDAVRFLRYAVSGGSAGGRMVSAELAVLPGGHHAARHRVAACAALPAGGDGRLSAGARSSAQPRVGGVCGHLLRILGGVCGTQFAPGNFSGGEPGAVAVVDGAEGGARERVGYRCLGWRRARSY